MITLRGLVVPSYGFSTTNERKLSLVKWNELCQPKSSGGLGLHDMRAMNDVFLMKLGWGLVIEPDSLWVRVLKSKYGILDNPVSVTNLNYSGSYLLEGYISGFE